MWRPGSSYILKTLPHVAIAFEELEAEGLAVKKAGDRWGAALPSAVANTSVSGVLNRPIRALSFLAR